MRTGIVVNMSAADRARLKAVVAERVVALTLADSPGETTHWTAVAMARASGISASPVRRIWRSHGLQPHRFRRFKLSSDPQFAAKLRDIVGLYIDPPAAAGTAHTAGCKCVASA
jgi:hypothetical protein